MSARHCFVRTSAMQLSESLKIKKKRLLEDKSLLLDELTALMKVIKLFITGYLKNSYGSLIPHAIKQSECLSIFFHENWTANQ